MATPEVSSRSVVEAHLREINGKPKTAALLDHYVKDPALKEFTLQVERGFPSFTFEPEEIVAEGDIVAVRGISRGTHLGEFAGIAPTGKEIVQPSMVFYRVEGEHITQFWVSFDMTELLAKLQS